MKCLPKWTHLDQALAELTPLALTLIKAREYEILTDVAEVGIVLKRRLIQKRKSPY